MRASTRERSGGRGGAGKAPNDATGRGLAPLLIQRWYKEPWPWILMAGPAIVIVAGLLTAWIAFASSDGLVADDYYKQGLAINQELKRGSRALQLGLSAQVELSGNRLRVRLTGGEPEAIVAHLVHATRAGHDQRLRLARTGEGLYEGRVATLPAGRWQVAIEDPRREWRIVKEGL